MWTTTNSISALAQSYPNKPVRLIVPVVPGSPTDVIARIVAPRLAARLGQPVIIENRPGGGGLIGFELAAKSPPDGYTLVFGDINALAYGSLAPRASLDLQKDFTPVSLLAQIPAVLLVIPSLSVTSVQQLLQYDRANPKKLTYGTPSLGSLGHLAGEQFKANTGASMTNVPYKGGAQAGAALLAGEVQLAFVPPSEAAALTRGGKLRGLAITGDKRSSLAPGVPTFAEAGIRGVDAASQYGVFVPRDTPAAIVTKLNTELVGIVKSSDVRNRFGESGADAKGTTQEQFAAVLREAQPRWARMLQKEDVGKGYGGGGGAGSGGYPKAAAPPPPAVMPAPAPAPAAAAPAPKPAPMPAPAPAAAAPAPKPMPAPAPVAAAPAPKPMPAPAPAAAAPAPKPAPTPVGQIADAYWNTWFTRDDAVVDTLEKNKIFTFSLDLSRYQYRLNKSVQVDAGLQKKLRETKDKQFFLRIRPILAGGALAFVDPKDATHLMTVEIDRLRVKTGDTKESALVRDFRAGRIPLADFAAQTRASDKYEFKVLAKRDGCASIALSIWDESGQFPLDHLVHTVTIGTGPGKGKSCGDDRTYLQGGLATLLDTSLDRGSDASKNIDVALHVFEFLEGDSKRTAAIMVDRSRFQAGKPDASGAERGVYAWELQSTLSEYLGSPKLMLQNINQAHDNAEKGVDDAYSAVARELSVKLFSGREDQSKIADAALAALQDTVNRSANPTMVIRMYSSGYQPIYLPLGLLAARAPSRILAKPITIIQPLPRERYVSARKCINPWTFVIPQTLSPTGAIDLPNVVSSQPGEADTRWLRSLPALETWLSARTVIDDSAKPEGLVLLSHQGDGFLWFEQDKGRIPSEQVNRKFAPGSVAILSACSVGNPAGDNLKILNKLNENGIDAMIVSPFPVRSDYGIRLARNVVSAIRAAHSIAATPTLAEIFKSAANVTAKELSAVNFKFDEMALEFFILGDHNMQLCKP